MPAYTTPGIYYEFVDQTTQAITALRTDITAFIGIAQMGPAHRPVEVDSWQQFQSTFGNFLPNGYLAYSAKAFFENGGSKLYVVRVIAPEATASTTAVAQPADGSASLVSAVAGFAAGAVVTARQRSQVHSSGVQPADGASSVVDTVAGFAAGSAVEITQTLPVPVTVWRSVRATDPAAKKLLWDKPLGVSLDLTQPISFQTRHFQDLLLQSVDAGAGRLTWASPLDGGFNLAQTIDFATGGATSRGELFNGAGNPVVGVEASSSGIWGDVIAVTVSNSSLAATATSSLPQPSTGAASYVQSVTGFPVGSVVRVRQSQSPSPAIDYRVVSNIDPTMNLLSWDTPLPAAFDLTQQISFETLEFGISVSVSNSVREIFTGVSLVPAHPRYVEAAITSQYIRVKDLHATDPWPLNLPVNGVVELEGGRDGIAALRPSDFTGDPASERKWGLRTLEDVEVAIVAAPDILIEPAPAVLTAPLPVVPPDICCPGAIAPAAAGAVPPAPVEAAPRFTLDDVFRVQQAIIQHCQTMQFRFAVLDPPDFGYPSQQIELSEVQGWRQRFDSAYAALYFPWVLVRDPLQLGNQVVRRIPPSGHVAGVFANTDLSIGVHKAPANSALLWVQDLTTNVTPEMQGVLNPIGVDCLRVFPGRGLRVYGARTVSSDPVWRFVNVRRLVSMIEHALLLSLQWSVFEPNNFMLWQRVTVAARGFLDALWKKGALAGNTAADAYYVTCDATTNPTVVTGAGEMVVEIGVAPVLPAEFVVFRIGRTEDVLEVTEQ